MIFPPPPRDSQVSRMPMSLDLMRVLPLSLSIFLTLLIQKMQVYTFIKHTQIQTYYVIPQETDPLFRSDTFDWHEVMLRNRLAPWNCPCVAVRILAVSKPLLRTPDDLILLLWLLPQCFRTHSFFCFCGASFDPLSFCLWRTLLRSFRKAFAQFLPSLSCFQRVKVFDAHFWKRLRIWAPKWWIGLSQCGQTTTQIDKAHWSHRTWMVWIARRWRVIIIQADHAQGRMLHLPWSPRKTYGLTASSCLG